MPEQAPPRYQQIAAALRHLITEGEFGPGEYLPAETALARQWQVARGTARQALQVLEDERLIVPAEIPGQPRRVAYGRPAVNIQVRRTAVPSITGERPTGGADDWRAATMTAGRVPTQDIEVVTVAADTGLAGRMGIPQGTLLTSRRLRRYADGDLDNLITFWYLADIARGTPLEDPADITEGAVAWLEERHPLAHEALIELHLAGQPLAVEACRAMGVPPSPLLVVWRVGRDRAGTVLVASRAIYPPGTKLRIEGP